MSPAARAGAWGAAGVLPSAGAVVYFAVPEPWGALLWFYLFLVCGALIGASLARKGSAAPAALRFGVAFAIPGAVLPFSLLPAEGLTLAAATAAAWGLALATAVALGTLVSGPRLVRARSRVGAAVRAGGALLVSGASGGAVAAVLVAALPPRGYFAAWAVGLICALGLGGALFDRRS